MNYSDSFRNVFEKDYTWISGFMRNVRRYGDKTAMIYPSANRSWTYGEFNRVVNKLANSFIRDGLKPKNVVMYQLSNCPEFAFIYVSTQKIRVVNTPINYRLSSGEIALSIDDSKPEVFIFCEEQINVVKEALSLAKHKIKRLVAVSTSDSENFNCPDWCVTFDDYIKNMPDEEPKVEGDYNIYDETTRFYTSGTTGRPKGVPTLSINEVLSAHDVIMQFPMNYNDVTLNTTPWFHRGGLHCAGPCPTLYVGGCLVALPKFSPDAALSYIEKYKVSFVAGVPTVFDRLVALQRACPKDISSLHGIITMGSPLEKKACIAFQKHLTPNVFNGYGLTETFWNTFLRPFELPDGTGTAGISCRDDEVRIVKSYPDRHANPDDLVAMDGTEVGEIIVKSCAKSSYAYFNNEAETEKRYFRGFAYTVDLGVWDENQFVTVIGRKDDMIISQGENIYPTQVEEVLNTFEKVKECAVTSVPDFVKGEIVTAYIVPAEKGLSAEELDKFCKENPMLANYKRPRFYRFVDSIKRNATGKILHYEAKKDAYEDLKNGLLISV